MSKLIEPRTLPGFRDFLPPRLKRANRTAVFIDAANMLYSQRTLGWQIDYKKLIKLLKREFKIIYVGFYYGELKENPGQAKFFQMLNDRGYTLRTKPVKYIKTPKGTILKGNLDIELAFDVFERTNKFKKCFLFSGDSDFEPVLKFLRKKKKDTIVVSTSGHVSIELIRNCDKYLDLKKLRQNLERKQE